MALSQHTLSNAVLHWLLKQGYEIGLHGIVQLTVDARIMMMLIYLYDDYINYIYQKTPMSQRHTHTHMNT